MAYVKYHDPWGTYLVSAAALNHIEGQWDSITADADAHNHDTRYYSKATSDATFFGTSFYSGFDADLLDGQHYSDLLASVMPLGAIMIWSGTDATVPSGWHICDGGTYGGLASPDLRDRFVIGAGGDYAVGATGGPANYNGTIAPTGSVTVGDHILTTAELPTHDHSYTEYFANTTAKYGPTGANQAMVNAATSHTVTTDAMTSGDGSHGHTGSSISFTAIDPRPVYRSLYYIIKYA